MSRALLCCLWLTIVLIAPIRALAEPTKLRVTIQVPATEAFIGAPVVQFKNEVERESANSLSLEIFDKGQLYIDNEALDAVKSGAIDMGLVGLNQVTRIVPAASIMEQPFLFNFEALTRAATSPESEIRQLIDDAILKTIGVRVLWWETIGPQVIFTKDGDARVPAQIKDMKIRAFSETMANFVRHCGAVPLDVSSSKLHQALKEGTIDIAMISAAAVRTRDLWEVTRAITKTDHAAIEFLVVVNEKVWQSLSEEHRNIITRVAGKVDGETRARALQSEAAAYDFAREKGMKIYELTSREVSEWRVCSADVFTNYLEKGGELTRKLMQAYAKLRTQPCCSAGPTGEAFQGR
jgi:C4-dicarboxylate-binding protein DctP